MTNQALIDATADLARLLAATATQGGAIHPTIAICALINAATKVAAAEHNTSDLEGLKHVRDCILVALQLAEAEAAAPTQTIN